MFEQSPTLGGYRPELASVAAVVLAHESCTLNGETLVAGGGQVMRIAIVQNEGYMKDDMTAEDLVEHLDVALDVSEARIIEVAVHQGNH